MKSADTGVSDLNSEIQGGMLSGGALVQKRASGRRGRGVRKNRAWNE